MPESKMHTIAIRTNTRNELLDITAKVRSIVRDENIDSGICTIFSPHTTAAVTINENADPDVKSDILQKLSSMVPMREKYAHIEGNSDAHIKASLLGNSVQIIIENGQLMLGTWQGIYFCEFDGPRSRNAWVYIK